MIFIRPDDHSRRGSRPPSKRNSKYNVAARSDADVAAATCRVTCAARASVSRSLPPIEELSKYADPGRGVRNRLLRAPTKVAS